MSIWVAWHEEYPEEGSVLVEADSAAEAINRASPDLSDELDAIVVEPLTLDVLDAREAADRRTLALKVAEAVQDACTSACPALCDQGCEASINALDLAAIVDRVLKEGGT